MSMSGVLKAAKKVLESLKTVLEGLRRCFKVGKFGTEGGVCQPCPAPGRDWVI